MADREYKGGIYDDGILVTGAERDPRKIFYKGMQLIGSFGTWHSRMDNIRELTRERTALKFELNGQETTIPHVSRASAMVSLARAHSSQKPMSFSVPSKDSTESEDQKTSKLELWCSGVERAVRPFSGKPYRDNKWHFFESGMAITRTMFNMDRALKGQFPFDIDAIDPYWFSFRKIGGEIVSAAIEERKLAEPFYMELKRVQSTAKNAKFVIPPQLESFATSAPDTEIIVRKFYDQGYETMFMYDQFVWDRPHNMGRCPFDVGFCNDMPAEPSKPEEYGTGLIWLILDMLNLEQQLIAKNTAPADLFYYPLVAVNDGNKWRVVQAFPGQEIDSAATQVTPFNVTPNNQLLDHLATQVNSDVGRTAFNDIAFGIPSFRQSGFAWSQVLAGLQIKITDLLGGLNEMYSNHFGMLLERVQALATPEVVAEFGLTEDQAKQYYRSFGVQVVLEDALADQLATKPKKSLVVIKSADVDNHTIVDVTVNATSPQDESALYQRGLVAKQIGYSKEYIMRRVVKDDNIDQVEEWNRNEDLMANDPDWAQFQRMRYKKMILEKNKEMAQDYMDYQQALEEQQQQQQQDAMMNSVSPSTPLLGPGESGAAPGGGTPGGAPAGEGTPGMPNKASMGVQPTTPNLNMQMVNKNIPRRTVNA